MKPLLPRQKKFVDHYIDDTLPKKERTARISYKKYYNCKNDASADASASYLLAQPHIQYYIQSVYTLRAKDNPEGYEKKVNSIKSAFAHIYGFKPKNPTAKLYKARYLKKVARNLKRYGVTTMTQKDMVIAVRGFDNPLPNGTTRISLSRKGMSVSWSSY